MRWSYLIYPAMIALLLGGMWLAWSWHDGSKRREAETVARAGAAIDRITRELSYRATLHDTELNGRGWPTGVDPEWFGSQLPRNPLVPIANPWLEIAGEDQFHLSNPPQLLVVDRSLASFWYNPANGVVRARVGQTVSDQKALEIYNRVNATTLGSLFVPEGTRTGG